MSISLTPSASDWSMPQGPCRLGPMRSCIQATTLRSHTMENSTVTIRKAKQKTALTTTSHQGSRAEHGEVFGGEDVTRRRGESVDAVHLLLRSRRRASRCAGPMRTSAPGSAPVSAATPPPTEFSGSQTTRSGISVTCSGQFDRAGGAGDGEQIAVLDTGLGGRGGESARRRRAGCRRAPRRPPGDGPWSSSSRCPASTASPAAGRGNWAPISTRVGRRRVPSQAAEPVELRAARSAGRAARGVRPGRRPACAARARRSARARRVIWSGLSAASNRRARPSQLRKVPAFSATAATGRTTSACSVTSLGRSSSDDQEAHLVQRASRARAGSGRSADLDAGDHQRRAARRWRRPRRSGRCRGRSGAGVRRRPRRRRPRPARAGRSPGRPPGSSDGSAPASTAPALPGPARDPHQLGAGRGGGPYGGGQPAGRRRPAARRRRSRRPRRAAPRRPSPRSSSRPTPPASASSHSVSVPGAAGSSVPPAFSRPRRGVRGEGEGLLSVLCGRPCAAAGRRRAPPPRTRSRPAGRRAPSPARCR